MYEAYWKLTARPFSQTAEPALFYRSRSVQSALLRMQYAIENLNGPCVVPGMTGTGKSALIRYFPPNTRACGRSFTSCFQPSPLTN